MSLTSRQPNAISTPTLTINPTASPKCPQLDPHQEGVLVRVRLTQMPPDQSQDLHPDPVAQYLLVLPVEALAGMADITAIVAVQAGRGAEAGVLVHFVAPK